MAKKLSLLVAAAAAILAFAIPSTASAAEATCPTSLCSVGQKVVGTGSSVALDTELVGQLFCKGLTLNGEVTKNSGGVVEGKGPDELNPAQTECYNVEPSRKITVTTVELTNLTANASTGPAGATKTGSVSFVAKVDLPSGALCTFTTPAGGVPGTYVSGANPAVLTSSSTSKTVTSTGGCGKAQLTGSFTLKTNTGSNVVLK